MRRPQFNHQTGGCYARGTRWCRDGRIATAEDLPIRCCGWHCRAHDSATCQSAWNQTAKRPSTRLGWKFERSGRSSRPRGADGRCRRDPRLGGRGSAPTYGPPRPQGALQSDLISLRQRIRSQGVSPGQDGDPRVRGPHKGAGVERHLAPQISGTPVDCQAILLPPPADLAAARARCRAADLIHGHGSAPLEAAATAAAPPRRSAPAYCRAPPQPYSGALAPEARAAMPQPGVASASVGTPRGRRESAACAGTCCRAS